MLNNIATKNDDGPPPRSRPSLSFGLRMRPASGGRFRRLEPTGHPCAITVCGCAAICVSDNGTELTGMAIRC
jgi:hypothetical protein